MDNYELRDLSKALDVPIDRLRYVLNQELVPFRDWFIAEGEVGQPRRFDFITAVFIGCAAFMLEAGVKRDSVKHYMQLIGKLRPTGRNSLNVPILANAVTGRSTAIVQIADGAWVRWKTGNEMTDWINPVPKPTANGEYEPKIIVAMNVGHIRDLLRSSQADT